MKCSTSSPGRLSNRMLWALVAPVAIGGFGLTSMAADPTSAPAAPADASTPAPAAAPADVPPTAPDLATGQHLSLDYFDNWQTSPTLTGDWGGIRKQMADKGITADLTLVQVYQGVVNGGLDKGWQYGARDDVNINLDTQKMGLWPGGFLNVEGENHFGEFVGARQTGTILPADQNALFPEPGTNSYELSSLYYMQFISHQLGFYAGKIATITNDNGDANAFAHGKGGEGFLNSSLGWNPILAVTVPYSTLGAGAIILPTSDPKEFVINMAVVDTQGNAGESGFNTVFKGGTTYLGEGRYTTHFFHLTGHQLVGGSYSDTLYLNLDQNLRNLIIPGLPTQMHSGSWSAYYNFDQYLYQPDEKSDRGIGVFGRVGFSDGVANPIHEFYSGGVGGKGMIPSRDNDRFGLGYFYIHAANARIPEVLGLRDSEGFEAYYEIALTPWMHLTPDVQVLSPSQQRVDTATVLGVRLELKF
jgi:porin